jgi:hypothetical protein
MEFTAEQKTELLQHLQEVLPGVAYAPNEAWLEEGRSGKKGSETLLLTHSCSCGVQEEPNTLTVFLRGKLSGAHYNIIRKLERVVERWFRDQKIYLNGCGMCEGGSIIDVRFFRTDNEKPRFKEAESEEIL